MAKSLSILFVSSEVYPFAKESGIGDVAFSLPLALKELGHDVRIMLPKYGTISERKNRIHEINRLKDMPIPMGDVEELATVKSSSVQNSRNKVQAYITTNYNYFDAKKGVYHDPVTWEEYPDNAERFIFFNRSVVETCMLLGWYPDIIHCNGWQTALIPAYVNHVFADKFVNTKTVFTIHNLATQGESPLAVFNKTGMPEEIKTHFKHKNKFNFMKGGIVFADRVTTVSENYAAEVLKDKSLNNGLDKVLKDKGEAFTGILNGIDKCTWDPRKDKSIPKRYEDDFAEYKINNKAELINLADFDYKPKTPLIGMITRIDEQKGIPLLLESIDDLMQLDIQLLILGKGDDNLKDLVKAAAEKYPEKMKFVDEFNEKMAHMVEAGSDFYLMPSKFEPCGLNLMYSIVYGTMPIVHGVGGIVETAFDVDKDSEKGNSIVFNSYAKDSLVEAVKRATELFADKDKFRDLVSKSMEQDHSWNKSIDKYVEIYQSLM
jgi:starch synthase